MSANRRLIKGRGRFVANPDYAAMKNSMADVLRKSGFRFEGDVEVRLELRQPKQMDVDALVKPALDALQLAGVIDNDKQVKKQSSERIGGTFKKYGADYSSVTFYIKQYQEE